MCHVMDERIKTLPPPELIHNPSIKDVCGETCAMKWIEHVKTLPPPELTLRNEYGYTCAMIWNEYMLKHFLLQN